MGCWSKAAWMNCPSWVCFHALCFLDPFYLYSWSPCKTVTRKECSKSGLKEGRSPLRGLFTWNCEGKVFQETGLTKGVVCNQGGLSSYSSGSPSLLHEHAEHEFFDTLQIDNHHYIPDLHCLLIVSEMAVCWFDSWTRETMSKVLLGWRRRGNESNGDSECL